MLPSVETAPARDELAEDTIYIKMVPLDGLSQAIEQRYHPLSTLVMLEFSTRLPLVPTAGLPALILKFANMFAEVLVVNCMKL